MLIFMVIDEFSDIEMRLFLIFGSIVQPDPHEGATDIWETFRGSCKHGAERTVFQMKNKDLK